MWRTIDNGRIDCDTLPLVDSKGEHPPTSTTLTEVQDLSLKRHTSLPADKDSHNDRYPAYEQNSSRSVVTISKECPEGNEPNETQ